MQDGVKKCWYQLYEKERQPLPLSTACGQSRRDPTQPDSMKCMSSNQSDGATAAAETPAGGPAAPSPGFAPLLWLSDKRSILPLDSRTVQVGTGRNAVRLTGQRSKILRSLGRLREGTPASLLDPGVQQLHLQHLLEERHPMVTSARRKLASIRVDGLGLCGSEVATLLADAGAGTLLLADTRPVTAKEIGRSYRTVHHGQTRAYALRDALQHRGTSARVLEDQNAKTSVDLSIIIRGGAVHPQYLSEAAQRSRYVLPLVFEDEGWRMGPLFSAGYGVCAECLRLYGQEADPLWDALQGELAARGAAQEDPVTAVVAAGGASHQALTLIDAVHRPGAADNVLFFETRTGLWFKNAVRPHPDCDCHAQLGEHMPAGNQHSRETAAGRRAALRQ